MKLKDKRKELKLTQREVAAKVGIPSATMACKIAGVLNTTVEELYGED